MRVEMEWFKTMVVLMVVFHEWMEIYYICKCSLIKKLISKKEEKNCWKK
jgi:hypothetical protein